MCFLLEAHFKIVRIGAVERQLAYYFFIELSDGLKALLEPKWLGTRDGDKSKVGKVLLLGPQ